MPIMFRSAFLAAALLLLATCSSEEADGPPSNPIPKTYRLGGIVDGLAGGELVLAHGDERLSVRENGPFVFAGVLLENTAYEVAIHAQPSEPPQRCRLTGATGVVTDADVDSVRIDCVPLLQVRAEVSGLVAGTELRLQLNSSAPQVVSANGPVVFPDLFEPGAPYEVVATEHPTSPGQRCRLTDAAGTMSATSPAVRVDCRVTTSVLDAFASCDAAIEPVDGRDGTWVFDWMAHESSEGHAVLDPAPPCGVLCWVFCVGNCSTHVGRGVATFPFKADGSAIDLSHYAGLIVSGDVPDGFEAWVGVFDGPVSADAMANPACRWALPPMTGGHAYLGFSQAASPTGATGCTPTAVTGMGLALFTHVLTQGTTMKIHSLQLVPEGLVSGDVYQRVGVAVTGLTGRGLVLRNGAGDDLEVAGDGTHWFPTFASEGAAFDVRVHAQPAGPAQTCTVTNGAGTVGGADVVVPVECD